MRVCRCPTMILVSSSLAYRLALPGRRKWNNCVWCASSLWRALLKCAVSVPFAGRVIRALCPAPLSLILVPGLPLPPDAFSTWASISSKRHPVAVEIRRPGFKIGLQATFSLQLPWSDQTRRYFPVRPGSRPRCCRHVLRRLLCRLIIPAPSLCERPRH